MRQVKFRRIPQIFCLEMTMLFCIAGCASDGEKKLDQKLHAMKPENSAEVSRSAQMSIDQNKNLSNDQKVSMTELRKRTTFDLHLLQEQSLKLREILIQDFEADDSREISLIRDHLQALNNLQVELIFDTIKKANQIIGHSPSFRDSINELFSRQPEIYSH